MSPFQPTLGTDQPAYLPGIILTILSGPSPTPWPKATELEEPGHSWKALVPYLVLCRATFWLLPDAWLQAAIFISLPLSSCLLKELRLSSPGPLNLFFFAPFWPLFSRHSFSFLLSLSGRWVFSRTVPYHPTLAARLALHFPYPQAFLPPELFDTQFSSEPMGIWPANIALLPGGPYRLCLLFPDWYLLPPVTWERKFFLQICSNQPFWFLFFDLSTAYSFSMTVSC